MNEKPIGTASFYMMKMPIGRNHKAGNAALWRQTFHRRSRSSVVKKIQIILFMVDEVGLVWDISTKNYTDIDGLGGWLL